MEGAMAIKCGWTKPLNATKYELHCIEEKPKKLIPKEKGTLLGYGVCFIRCPKREQYNMMTGKCTCLKQPSLWRK